MPQRFSLSRRGLVCSRRQVLLNRPASAEELRSRRFGGVTLGALWDPLRRIPALEVTLRDLLFSSASRDIAITVYAELVLEGTASSKKDRFVGLL